MCCSLSGETERQDRSSERFPVLTPGCRWGSSLPPETTGGEALQPLPFLCLFTNNKTVCHHIICPAGGAGSLTLDFPGFGIERIVLGKVSRRKPVARAALAVPSPHLGPSLPSSPDPPLTLRSCLVCIPSPSGGCQSNPPAGFLSGSLEETQSSPFTPGAGICSREPRMLYPAVRTSLTPSLASQNPCTSRDVAARGRENVKHLYSWPDSINSVITLEDCEDTLYSSYTYMCVVKTEKRTTWKTVMSPGSGPPGLPRASSPRPGQW